jgi:hypothetical protein
MIVAGFETAYDIVNADHAVLMATEARFTRIGYRIIRGFDYTVINAHAFNGGDGGSGETIMFQVGNESYKPLNLHIVDFHDENCQSVACGTRITFDVPKPNTYMTIDRGYISTSSDHILLRTKYKSWIGYIRWGFIRTSNPVNMLVVNYDGAILHRFTKYLGLVGVRDTGFSLFKTEEETVPGVYYFGVAEKTVNAGITNLLSKDMADNDRHQSIVIVSFTVDANDSAVTQTIELRATLVGSGGVELEHAYEKIDVEPNLKKTTTMMLTTDVDGYVRVDVKVDAPNADTNTIVKAKILWLRL